MPTPPCKNCNSPFQIEESDMNFYNKIDTPPPTFCPKCRLQRRLSYRNERNLFKRKCDKSGINLISNMRPEAPFPVYHIDEWNKDDWDAPQIESFDFNKSFFEQFSVISKTAPRMHRVTGGNELNSEYTNHSGNCKNCYFIFNSEYIEDGMYLRFADHVNDCVDCTNIIQSELCYECVNVTNCNNLKFSDDCKACQNSYFLRYCRNVKDSIFCYGLQHKQYHIFNKPYSKEAYEEKVKELALHTYSGLQKAKEEWEEFSKQFPKIRKIQQNCENCTGDSLYNCKNTLDCYNCSELEDCRYVLNSVKVKDTYDLYAYGEVELCYEYVTAFKSYDIKFSCYVMNSSHIEYSEALYNCKNCFGCVALKNKSYCILNKQYSKEEYEDLLPRIKAKMKEDKEYGEFLPPKLSPYPYEDTLANDYYPISTKTDESTTQNYQDTNTLPNDISQADIDTLTKESYLCPVTKKPFRFQLQELNFYKKLNIPLPRKSFEARYKERNKLIPFPY